MFLTKDEVQRSEEEEEENISSLLYYYFCTFNMGLKFLHLLYFEYVCPQHYANEEKVFKESNRGDIVMFCPATICLDS
jgi:hypothetical protein